MSTTAAIDLWRGHLVFVLLGTAPGTDPEAYLHAYMSGQAHRAPVDAHQVTSTEGGAITARELLADGFAKLPLLDLSSAPAGVDPRRLAYLRAVAPSVLERLTAWLPLLPGEQVISARMAAFGADWHSIPAGTMCCVRESNQATMAFCLLGHRLDMTSAEVLAAAAPSMVSTRPVSRVATAATLRIDDSTATVIDAALTLAQFAGFALGPAGLILSGGAAVMQMIFGKMMSSQQQPLSAVVAKAVTDVMVALNLEDADATIGTDYDWLSAHYKAAWTGDAPPSDSDFKRFRNELEDKLDSDTGIRKVVKLLAEPSYEQRGFALYMLGNSLVLLMLKIALIIESSDKRVTDSYQYNSLMAQLQASIDHADATTPKIDKIISDRLGQINQPSQQSHTMCGNMGSCASEYYWEWDDGGDRHMYPDTFSGTCGGDRVEHRDDAQRDRDAHYNSVHAELDRTYYGGDPAKVRQSVDQWRAMKAEFAKYAPH